MINDKISVTQQIQHNAELVVSTNSNVIDSKHHYNSPLRELKWFKQSLTITVIRNSHNCIDLTTAVANNKSSFMGPNREFPVGMWPGGVTVTALASN